MAISATKPSPTLTEQCGTTRGYHAHHRRGERPCQPCLDANRAYRRGLRADRYVPKEQRTEPTDTGACGTPKGYQRHTAAGEHACADCKQAMTDRQHDYYHRGGGDEVQRRRRGTATYKRLDREGHQRREDQRRLDELALTDPEPSRWRQALARLRGKQ